jgi:tetratricopeptide (TPR) repeat protein
VQVGEPRAAPDGPQRPATRVFVSYTAADRSWAEWIAWQLETAGFPVRVQAWDFRAGDNFVAQMNRALGWADRVVAVLSDAYFASPYAQDEWTAALTRSRGEPDRLLPVRVAACEVPPLIATRIWVDLVGVDEATAVQRLLAGIAGVRAKPAVAPAFPGTGDHQPALHPAPLPPRFPGVGAAISNLPPRNPRFRGRARLLRELDRRLRSGGAVAVVATHGLGGIGKTQLVLEYAHRHADEYELVWWVVAESPISAASGLAELAPRLGVAVETDLEATVAVVLAALRGRARWLLVYDNVEDPQQVAGLLPGGGGGRVLVTSRNPAVGAVAASVPVEVLTAGEAVGFLLARSRDPDRPAAAALAEELGGLPLALAQAVAYCEQTGVDLAGYLRRYRARQAELLARGNPTGYPATVATTWQLNIDRLDASVPAAVELLRLCAFLAPDAVPLDLLTADPVLLPPALTQAATDELALDEAIAGLYRYSLCARDRTGLRVHRLVQAVVRDRLDPETATAWARRTVLLLLAALPDTTDNPWGWPRFAALLAHAQAASGHAEALGAADASTAELLSAIGGYLLGRGQYADAREYLERALAMMEAVHGPDHRDVAPIVSRLGGVLFDLGDLLSAREHYERAVAIQEVAYGPDHPKVGMTLVMLGSVCRQLGELTSARTYLERALGIVETAYGPDHPDVGRVLVNLGGVVHADGERAAAWECWERALAIMETASPDHPDTARPLQNLGYMLHERGELARARKYFERALAIFEAAYGPDHFHVAGPLISLGQVASELGDLVGAREYLEHARRITQATLGSDHNGTQKIDRLLNDLPDRPAE